MKKYMFPVFILIISFLLSACATKEEVAVEIQPTNAPEPTAVPYMTPGEPSPEAERILEDSDASLKAAEKRVVSGDNFLNNLYERPFTSLDMDYQPDLNILTVSIFGDELFYYFTITLDGANPTSGMLSGNYGIEFDRTQSGRGDMLVMASSPNAEWTMDNVTVYVDPNGTVGGTKPVVAEAGYEESGYTDTFEMTPEKVAWARLAPDDPNAIQIAVSRALLDDPEEFLWGAWADGGLQDPSLFDYDDHFGPSAAGSPVRGEDYPVKEVANLDNTCRLPYGFEASGGIPGICISIPEPSHQVSCVCVQWATVAHICIQWSCQ